MHAASRSQKIIPKWSLSSRNQTKIREAGSSEPIQDSESPRLISPIADRFMYVPLGLSLHFLWRSAWRVWFPRSHLKMGAACWP